MNVYVERCIDMYVDTPKQVSVDFSRGSSVESESE